MPTGLVVALGTGLAVLLVLLLVGLVIALRSTTSMVEALGQRLAVLERDATQLRDALGAVDEDLDRVVDALGQRPGTATDGTHHDASEARHG